MQQDGSDVGKRRESWRQRFYLLGKTNLHRCFSFFLSFFFLFFATSLRYDAVQFSFTFPLLLLSFFFAFSSIPDSFMLFYSHPSSLFPILPHPSRFFLFSLFFCFLSLIALCFLVFSSVFLQIINYFSWTLLHSPVILSFSLSFPVHLFDASHFSPFLLFLDSILVSCFSLVLFHKPFS